MVNEVYVDWLVSWINNGVINTKTGLPFVIDDIKNVDYKSAVQAKLDGQ